MNERKHTRGQPAGVPRDQGAARGYSAARDERAVKEPAPVAKRVDRSAIFRRLVRATEAADAPASWLELVVALLKQRNDYRAAIPWLERLIELAPDKKTYWLELSVGDRRGLLASARGSAPLEPRLV